MARPKRLPGINYTGFAAYFITACTLDRRKAFTTQEFCGECELELFACGHEFGFTSIAYCFMPDHIHILVEATREDSSLPKYVAMWKQRTGFAWSERSGSKLWQKGYWERVLRSEDDVLGIARYVVENPVRAGLVSGVKDYPFSGSEKHTLDEIMTAYQMDLKSGWHR
jgi:putative transposase